MITSLEGTTQYAIIRHINARVYYVVIDANMTVADAAKYYAMNESDFIRLASFTKQFKEG